MVFCVLYKEIGILNVKRCNMKLLFIISHKYYRNYRSYIELYINNIQSHYNDADILIVDNNSKYYNDIEFICSKYNNVNFIINTSNSKYEIGAYRFGINFLNNKINEYDYVIFTQDTFILINKYDFNILKLNNVKACTLVSDDKTKKKHEDWNYTQQGINLLSHINLYNRLEEITFCFSNSFILHSSVISKFMDYTNHFILLTKGDSGMSECFLARLLYELNNNKNYDIDGLFNYTNKNIHEGDLNINFDINQFKDYYFVKILQRKNENTTE